MQRALKEQAAGQTGATVVTTADSAPMFNHQLPGGDDADLFQKLCIVSRERPAAAIEFAVDRTIKNGGDDDDDEPDNTEVVGGGRVVDYV